MAQTIEHYHVNELYFDVENPRLVEFNISASTPEKKIMNILWIYMAVDEIVMSILAHGFFDHEAIYAVRESGKLVIVEGNRRLAAVKSILHPELIGTGMNKFLPKITEEKKKDLEEKGLPVIVLDNRAAAWRYIGFKHVNGAAKWGSYAKAQYIASVHDNFGMSLDEIAEQIGDANNTVKKLYQGLMVIKEAEKRTSFRSDDTYNNRLYFSHLYTAIGYEGFRKYIALTLNSDGTIIIPEDRTKQLGELMIWLYGSKSEDIEPMVKSQNPDLKRLDAVLQNKEAIISLQNNASLNTAFEITIGGSEVLFTALVNAKVAVQKALANSAFFDGEEEILRIAGTIADTADNLYSTLEKIYKQNNPEKTKRLSE